MEKYDNLHPPINDKPENIQDNLLERNKEKTLFREYFSGLGYQERQALPLTPPESDSTVPFVGSSINTFKEYLEERRDIEVPSLVLQPCIRTQDIIHGYDVTKIPFGMPFFHIYGTFSPRGTYKKTAADVMGYFRDAHKIPNEDILIKPTVPELSEKLLAPFISVGAQVEVDTSRYYEWKYGIKGISGRGVTLFIRHSGGGWWDVGNVVSISDENEEELASEFGTGSEFFQTALQGYDDPFDASYMAKIVKPDSSVHKKVLTYLETALAASGTLAEGRTRTIRMTNRYINIAHFLCEVHGYSRDDVELIAHAYHDIATTRVDINLFLKKYDTRTQVFRGLGSILIDYLNNPLHGDINLAQEQLREYLKKNGMRSEELTLYIAKNYSDNDKVQSLCRNL